MVKQIIWSARAKQDKKEILEYWLKRNKSNVYPQKLNNLFKLAVGSLAKNPFPRKKVDYGDAFVRIVRDYFIIFEEDNNTIYILLIWDTRQDPRRLTKILT